jgi:hypothetical protein
LTLGPLICSTVSVQPHLFDRICWSASVAPRLFDRICWSACLAGRHARVLAALSRFSQTVDLDGRRGSTPSPVFTNSEVTGTDPFNFKIVMDGQSWASRGKIGDNWKFKI